jgi:hypothetical protein
MSNASQVPRLDLIEAHRHSVAVLESGLRKLNKHQVTAPFQLAHPQPSVRSIRACRIALALQVFRPGEEGKPCPVVRLRLDGIFLVKLPRRNDTPKPQFHRGRPPFE